MSDYGPSSDTLRDALPLLRFTSAMRWPRERARAPMPDEEAMAAEEMPVSGRRGEIEARIARLAERFDQLEFVIVEQFEPGMTGTGDLPAGNLRDRLDRIEARLGLLSRDAPGTPAPRTDAAASGEEATGAVMLPARQDETIPAPAAPGSAAEALEARLAALEKRLETGAEEAAARHGSLLSALGAEGAAREAACGDIVIAAEARQAHLGAALTADLDARQTALLAAIEAMVAARDAAREAAGEAMTAAASLHASLLARMTEETETRHAALLAALRQQAEAQGETLMTVAAAEAARRTETLAAFAEAAETRLAAHAEAAATEMAARQDTLLDAVDRAMSHAAPAPDLAQQQRSFAGFATALKTTLSQFEMSADAILDRLDAMARRLEAVEAHVGAPAALVAGEAGAAPVTGAEAALGELSDGIGALVAVFGRRPAPAREPEAAMLDELRAAVTAAVDDAARGSRSAMDETLRDLRAAVAELAADGPRLRSA